MQLQLSIGPILHSVPPPPLHLSPTASLPYCVTPGHRGDTAAIRVEVLAFDTVIVLQDLSHTPSQ